MTVIVKLKYATLRKEKKIYYWLVIIKYFFFNKILVYTIFVTSSIKEKSEFIVIDFSVLKTTNITLSQGLSSCCSNPVHLCPPPFPLNKSNPKIAPKGSK